MDECPLIAYCVSEFETVFRDLLFWHFLFISQYRQIKALIKYKCFTVSDPIITQKFLYLTGVWK